MYPVEIQEPGPVYASTEPSSPITSVAAPLLTWLGDQVSCIGTATIIRPGLALTARHVVFELLRSWRVKGFEHGVDDDYVRHIATVAAPFHTMVMQNLPTDPTAAVLWRGTSFTICPFTDIAILRLTPFSENWQQAPMTQLVLDFEPPPVGSRIRAFGYPASESWIEEDQTITHKVDGHTSTGYVRDVYEPRRERGFLNFPCFRTDARFEGAMSGGPIFNEAGQLCALISAGADGDVELNYGALLWPIATTLFDVAEEGQTPDFWSFSRLAAEGSITIQSADQVVEIDGRPARRRSGPAPT